MIKIPYEDIISKIKEGSGVDEKEIETKVEEKLKQLSGLISKEGAAHIVANELGVKLFQQVSGKLQIKNILAGMRDVETVGKVVQVYDVREFVSGERQGKVGSMVVGDESGTIRVVFWGDQTDIVKEIKPGDVFKVSGGYVKDNRGQKEIHVNDRSNCLINPEGETIDIEIKPEVSGRKQISELSESDNGIDILGTVVQVFEPRFYEVCPDCGKRARSSGEGFMCATHNQVVPAFAYVLNAVVDDGSETIRVAFFRQQVEQLTKKSNEEILQIKEDLGKFEEVRNNLQGTIIKVNGRVNKNEMFDRIEFIAQNVDPEPDPGKEAERLKNT